jgi:hypothetical protein
MDTCHFPFTMDSHQMTHAVSASLFLAALTLSFSMDAGAADDDAINPDRPGVAETSQVVGKGRVQLETSVQWDRQRDDSSHERTLYSPTLLRVGIGESTELRVETDGRKLIHASDPATGQHTVTAGWADTEVGLKWHLNDAQDGQAGAPSLGVLLHAALPSGSRELRGHGLRPSLRLAAEWELPHGLSLGVMPGVGIDSDDDGARYGYGILAAELGKEFNERLHGFVELALPQIARAPHGGTQASLNTGLTYLVNKDCQLDVQLMHGLNHRSPDLSLAFGISVRR